MSLYLKQKLLLILVKFTHLYLRMIDKEDLSIGMSLVVKYTVSFSWFYRQDLITPQ